MFFDINCLHCYLEYLTIPCSIQKIIDDTIRVGTKSEVTKKKSRRIVYKKNIFHVSIVNRALLHPDGIYILDILYEIQYRLNLEFRANR